MSRSSKALKNVATGLINKVLMLFLAFATRTLFIRLLGAEYNGVSSLYTNILSVLSLAELGLSNVLMFYLYGAIKDKDEDRICLLVQEFKKIYTYIIVIILSVGLILVPFLKYIVNSSVTDCMSCPWTALFSCPPTAQFPVQGTTCFAGRMILPVFVSNTPDNRWPRSDFGQTSLPCLP